MPEKGGTMITDPTTHLGYRAHSKARSTGTLVTLVDAYEAGYETPIPGAPHSQQPPRWYTVCEDHDSCVGHDTQSVARSWLSAPEQWCELCQEDRQRKLTPAGCPGQPCYALSLGESDCLPQCKQARVC